MSQLNQQVAEAFEALQAENGGQSFTLAERIQLLSFAVGAKAHDATSFDAVVGLGLVATSAFKAAEAWRNQHANLSPTERLQQAIDDLTLAYAKVAELEKSHGAGGPDDDDEDEDDAGSDADIVAALTTERDQLKAANEVLLGKVADLIAANELLEKNQSTAEELSRRQLMKVGQPPVGCDATGGQQDGAKMTLTERCQAAVAAKQSGNRFRI